MQIDTYKYFVVHVTDCPVTPVHQQSIVKAHVYSECYAYTLTYEVFQCVVCAFVLPGPSFPALVGVRPTLVPWLPVHR